MAITTVAEVPGFTVGGVASATFGSIGRNLATFAFLALLAEVPIQVLAYFTNRFRVDAAPVTAYSAAAGAHLATILASSFLTIFMGFVLQAAIVHGTVTDLNGRRASFGTCLTTALKVLVPLAGLAIVTAFGMFLGLMLLVVPGVILALGWSIAVPVKVVERAGVFDSLSRSWDLTSGFKGTIFLLVLVIELAGLLFNQLGISFGGLSPFTRHSALMAYPIGYFVYSGVVRGLEAMVHGAGVATIYYQLRQIKEGIAPEQLAAVFD